MEKALNNPSPDEHEGKILSDQEYTDDIACNSVTFLEAQSQVD